MFRIYCEVSTRSARFYFWRRIKPATKRKCKQMGPDDVRIIIISRKYIRSVFTEPLCCRMLLFPRNYETFLYRYISTLLSRPALTVLHEEWRCLKTWISIAATQYHKFLIDRSLSGAVFKRTCEEKTRGDRNFPSNDLSAKAIDYQPIFSG